MLEAAQHLADDLGFGLLAEHGVVLVEVPLCGVVQAGVLGVLDVEGGVEAGDFLLFVGVVFGFLHIYCKRAGL